MSLNKRILSIVGDITDPAVRIEIAQTIRFLYEVWLTGRVSPEEILSSLREVAYTILTYKHPEMPEEEKKEKAKALAEDLFKAFRIESLYRTTFVRMKPKILM